MYDDEGEKMLERNEATKEEPAVPEAEPKAVEPIPDSQIEGEEPKAETGQNDASSKPGSAFEPGAALSYRTQGARNDGMVEIAIESDGMLATASFYPPTGEGLPLSVDYVRELLARLGVVSGVLWDEIGDVVMRCNLERKIIRGMAVARGTAPVAEVPEHAALEPRFRRTGPLVGRDVQRVDFRELSSFFVVHVDETIARIVPRKAGVPGSDVHGSSIPYPRESPENVSAGRNVVQREDRLAAAVDGRLIISESRRLDVDEVLIVKGGVDYHTGHIAFPGDVIIDGAVRDGFRVHSGGSIVCKATLDAFDVDAKKDLSCPQGIIGRRRAQVRVGGELSAKYIQNCKVAVRGNVNVAAAIVNSRVLCLGTVDLGDKGVVMGGEVHALHGLRCGRLGNQALQRTLVLVGTDFAVQQRLAQANERIRLIAARSRQIEAAAKAHPGAEVERAKAEIAKAAAQARDQVASLLGKLDADDSAVVEVAGEIFPGVVIEICRVSITVDQPLKACKFHLDKAAGRIVVEK
jgi:uncharacterized protein (DUF342 family)